MVSYHKVQSGVKEKMSAEVEPCSHDWKKISPRLWRISKSVDLLFHVYSMFVVLYTMTQRLLSVYFCFPVQPMRVKCEYVIDTLFWLWVER